jgi:hypothetical protein
VPSEYAALLILRNAKKLWTAQGAKPVVQRPCNILLVIPQEKPSLLFWASANKGLVSSHPRGIE